MRLQAVGKSFVILASLQFDRDETDETVDPRQRFVLEVRVKGLSLQQKLELWDELSLSARKAKSDALTKEKMPRLEPFDVGKNLIVHMDLSP
ncbi:MAG: hypothetical protein JRN38_07155, partial [Nitrososphaerota archaeon]|nr:hypothetical protein [Nitrososphaerota archaeon]